MPAFYCNVRQYGDDLLYVGYNDKGSRVQEKIPFKPILYIPSQDGTPPDAHSYNGEPLKAVELDSIKEAKDFINTYRGVSGFELYGMDRYPYQFVNREYPTDVEYDVQQMRIHIVDIEVRSDNGFPDPHHAQEEITCMSLKDIRENDMHVWVVQNKYGGNFDPDNLQYIDKDDLTYNIVLHAFDNERDMLRDFVAWYSCNYPDILSGWYSRHFDVPYIYNRLRKVLGSKHASKLSPWGMVKETTTRLRRFGSYKDQKTYDIYGTSELDYQDLYMKYSFSPTASYKLENITKKHLGKGKLKYDGTLHELLMSDYQKYVEYNIIDVERIHQLDKALMFFDLIVDVSYAGKVATFNDSLGTVRYWEMLIYNHLCEKKQQPPIKDLHPKGGLERDTYAGAYVKTPVPGKHKWIVSFDVASLYPSLIRQLNIGPETKTDFRADVSVDSLINKSADLSMLKEHDLSMAANGVTYMKDRQSFISELMEKFFNKRKVYKTKMLEAEQMYQETKDLKYKRLQIIYHVKQLATKILINSAYGACGNVYFQYYDVDNAEAITVSGQAVIQWIEKRVNSYLNTLFKEDKDRVVYMDTDSMYICMEDLVHKLMPGETDTYKVVEFLDKVCNQKLKPVIEKACQEFFEYMNNYTPNIVMERDVISDTAVWTGKKRYFMNVQDAEGVRYNPPKFKVMGIEVVKSSTPAVVQGKLKEALIMILREDEETLINFIDKFKKEFKSYKPEQVAFPRSVTELDKWICEGALSSIPDSTGKVGTRIDGSVKSGCPIHVRGALLHNRELTKRNLTNKYDPIKEGEKILFTYLKLPNALHENVVSFIGEIPTEFGLDKYVDYDKQFEKTFLEPLKSICETVGWKTQRVNNLSALFV